MSSDTILKRSQVFHLGVSNNGTTYAITNDGELYLYQPSSADFSFVSKLNTHTMSHPNPFHHHLLSKVDHGDHRFLSNHRHRKQEAQSCWASANRLFCPSRANARSNIEVYRSPSGTKITAFFATLDNFVAVFLDSGDAFKVSTTLLQKAHKINVDVLDNSSPTSFIELDDGSIFLGTDEGVFRADGLDGTFYKVFTGRHQRITGLSSDNAGLWVSSESGIGYLTPTRSQNWPDNDRNPLETLSFSRSVHKGYLIGTHDGIFQTNEELCDHNRVWPAKHGLAVDSRIPSIAVFEELIFSGSFRNGISVFERKKGSQYLHLKYTALQNSGITVLHASDGQLFAGTFSDGLYHFDSGRFVSIPLSTFWAENRDPITSISRAHGSSNFVITTEKEVYLICRDLNYEVCGLTSQNTSFGKHTFLTSSSDKNGDIWIGTLQGGLFTTSEKQLRDRSFLSYVPIPSLLEKSIYTANHSTDGSLWLGTNEGLFRVGTELDVQKFGFANGLISEHFHHGASMIDGDRLFVGSPHGYSALEISPIEEHTTFSYLWLRSITINESSETSRRIPDVVQLPAGSNSVSIKVDLNDLRNPLQNRYQYLLDGFDNAWRDSHSNIAIYRNLPSGEYSFHARGFDSFGNPSKNIIELPISVSGSTENRNGIVFLYVVALIAVFFVLRLLSDYRRQVTALQNAEQQSRALTKLEDDYAEQIQANNTLIARRRAQIKSLLHVIEAAIDARDASGLEDSPSKALPLIEYTTALGMLEDSTNRTIFHDGSNLNGLANDLFSHLATRHDQGSRAIFLNDVTEQSVLFNHAQYLSLVILEVLNLAAIHRRYTDTVEPIVQIRISPPALKDDGGLIYTTEITDNGLPPQSEGETDECLFVSHYLTDHLGGSVVEQFDCGNLVIVNLEFEADKDPAS